MKHDLYLFIAAPLSSKNQQNIHRFVACQKQALISKKVFVYIKKKA